MYPSLHKRSQVSETLYCRFIAALNEVVYSFCLFGYKGQACFLWVASLLQNGSAISRKQQATITHLNYQCSNPNQGIHKRKHYRGKYSFLDLPVDFWFAQPPNTSYKTDSALCSPPRCKINNSSSKRTAPGRNSWEQRRGQRNKNATKQYI